MIALVEAKKRTRKRQEGKFCPKQEATEKVTKRIRREK